MFVAVSCFLGDIGRTKILYSSTCTSVLAGDDAANLPAKLRLVTVHDLKVISQCFTNID